MLWISCLYPWDLSNDHSVSNAALPGKQILNDHCALFETFSVNPKAHRRDTRNHIFHHARKSELPVWSCKIDPGKLTWNPKMMVSKRNLLFKGAMFSFYIPSAKLPSPFSIGNTSSIRVHFRASYVSLPECKMQIFQGYTSPQLRPLAIMDLCRWL